LGAAGERLVRRGNAQLARGEEGHAPHLSVVTALPTSSLWTRRGLGTELAMNSRVSGGPTVAEPFHFTSVVQLPEMLGRRARDEQELLDLLEEVPIDTIYHHTAARFLRFEV